MCNNDSVSLSLSSTADFTKFIFSSALPVGVLPGNLTLTDATGTTSFTASISGTDSIISSVYLTDSAYGCAGAPDSVMLKVYPTPSVAFLHDGITLVNDTVCANSHNDDILFINHSQGNTSYSWTSGDTSVFEPILPGFYLSGNTGIFPGFQSYNNSSHRKTDSVTIVAEASGCRDTSYLSIVVDPVPHINDLTDSSVLYSNDTVMPSVTFFLHDSLGISTGFEWYNEDSSGNNIGKIRITTGVNIIPAMADSTSNTEPTTLPNTFVVTPLILIASTDSTCYGPPTNFTIKVKPIAALSSAHDTTVCDSVLFYYVPASATPDASFSWVRNAQSGISNAPGGSADDSTGDINEVLADTTNSPVLVKYFFTISSPEGGINHDTVKVTVSPRPKLNPVTPAAFCSNTPYNIALTSPTAGPVSYRWMLDTAGLSHIMKPGSGLLYADSAANSEISDTLLNTSYDTLHVSYAVMLTLTNGCANEQTAAITIHPTPALAPVAPPSFNTNTADSIKVTLLTEDAVYYHWQRQYATGITGTSALAADSGAAPLITDHLTNTTDDSVEVAYTFTLTGTRYPGCTAILTDSLYIHPKPRIYLFDTTVCGDSLISYTVHSPTEGNVTYLWYRDTMLTGTLTVSGNNAAPDSIVHEYVANTTDSVVTAVYCFKVFANTDSSADTIYVKINPTPRLTFNPSPAFCNISQDSLVLTVPTTGIINTTWSRAITPGISNPYNYGAGSDTTRIFEILNDTTNFIVPVNYTLALYATNGLLQCPSPLITVTDSIKPTPVINVVHPANCNDSAVSFIVTSPTEGAHNYTWYLDTAATAGYLIPNPLHGYNASTTNTDSMVAGLSLINPNDTLVHAPYYFTVSANGCSNVVQVIDTVRPTPVFADSVAILREICSGLPVNITVGSPTEGTVTYNWALSTVPGITYTGITEGSGNAIHDTLNNVDSVKQLTVVYVFTLTADGCTNDTPKIVYNIDPIPHLNSIKAMRICGDSLFYYDATSSVTDITNGYSWKSPNTTAYDFLPNFGNGDTISGVRINKVFGANSPVDSVQVNVINFILSERGCVSDSASNSNNVYITVEPRPLQPIISVYPAAASLCQGSEFLNFGDSLADPSVTYLWQCYLDGAPHPQFLYQLDSQNTQSVFAVMKFDTAGTYHIILKAYISPVTDTLATCYTTDTLTYTISAATDTNNDTARVIYQDNMLICLKNNQYDITHYQWGYDNTHLTPILIDTVINGDSTGNQQNYYAPSLDTANKHWWVETWQGDMGCIQKSYYNPPDYTAYFGRTAAPANTQNWQAVSMKVYPNPAQNIIKAALTDNTLTDLHFEIYDITGRKIMEQPANGSGNLTELPVTGLVPGCYFITCMQQGKRIGIARFIKN